jgi:hypothetical protein
MFYQELTAGMTTNGQLRRIFILYDERGLQDRVIDGNMFDRDIVKGYRELPTYEITGKEYRWLKTQANKRSETGRMVLS